MLAKIKALVMRFQTLVDAALVSGSAGTVSSQIAKMTEMARLGEELRTRFPDSVALRGYKVCSQNDEDGIIAAIFDAVGGNRSFLEIGIEDGTECNTHFLALKGWRGVWVEANAASAASVRGALGGDTFPKRLKLVEDYARTDNIERLYGEACRFCEVDQLDFFSLDIDGNDLWVLTSMLASGARPGVICVEYNGKFPPPLSISVTHDDRRGWKQDDYFGASLQAFDTLLTESDYALVACNLSGTNAFYVRRDRLGGLASYTAAEAWQPLRHYLTVLPAVHVPTLKFLRDVLRRPSEQSG